MSLPNVARGIDDDANLAELKALGATAVRASATPSTGVRSFFLVGVAAIAADLAEEQARERDIVGVDARETKPPGEKMFAFFQLCARAFARTARWCIKTDDDTYVHSVRLELNLRSLWDSTPSQEASPRAASPAEAPPASAGGGVADPSTGGAGGGAGGGAVYVYGGATLWASYVKQSFHVCGHGMGPMMAAGASRTEGCAAQGAVGPFPYAAGTLEVLSMPLARWVVSQPAVVEFVRRARGSGVPSKWDIGEDTVLGMWVHEAPFALTCLHWGWDKIHDLCFLCRDKAQLWKPITTQSVVVHIKGHQANQKNFHDIHRNFTRICSGECLRKHLPFDVPSLADLCSRGNIRQTYSKCTAL